jgi:hypothetical protein
LSDIFLRSAAGRGGAVRVALLVRVGRGSGAAGTNPGESALSVCFHPRFSDQEPPAMTDATHTTTPPPLPDHLSVDPRSPHHVAEVFQHDIGIRFNGKDRTDVEEYCISEGWVKVPAGKTVDRKGQPLMIKLKGKVEAFYK